MSSNEKSNVGNKMDDSLMDNSINDARWLLGGVATLGFLVMVSGFFASMLTV